MRLRPEAKPLEMQIEQRERREKEVMARDIFHKPLGGRILMISLELSLMSPSSLKGPNYPVLISMNLFNHMNIISFVHNTKESRGRLEYRQEKTWI